MSAATSTDPHKILRAYLLRHGLKASRQRDVIADVFFRAGGHLRVEELLSEVRKVDPKVSQATVYRTMKLLADCGLAEPRRFGDGQTRYEATDQHGDHHDHLICTSCGKIVEFVNDRIESMQDKVAGEHGFLVTHHKMELYGLCPECQAKTR
jgi:Fur family transcriptional regulator, ferric uptake regulator